MKLERLEAALAAFEAALKTNPNTSFVEENKKMVMQRLEQQKMPPAPPPGRDTSILAGNK